MFAKFGKHWYAESFSSYSAFPAKLFASAEFAVIDGPASELYTSFIAKLQEFLSAEMATNFSIPALWNETSGIDVPLTTYVNEVSASSSYLYKHSFMHPNLFSPPVQEALKPT